MIIFTGCSTGPDYKRNSEYDIKSNNYRSGTPRAFKVTLTEEALYHLSWADVDNNDGFIAGKYVYEKDSVLYKQLGITEADETSLTDSSGINDQLYSYTITSFIDEKGSKRLGRDSSSIYAEAGIGSIVSFDYSPADQNDTESRNTLDITTKTVPEANWPSDHRYEFRLITDIILEYKTHNSDSFDILDTLSVPINADDDVYHVVDTVLSPVKKFRAKPLLKTKNIDLEGKYTREINRIVSNPYRMTLNRLDESLIEYTITVPENLENEAGLFEGVYLYLNDAIVDTLKGTFPIKGTLNSSGESENIKVSFEAFTGDFITNTRSKAIDAVVLDKPLITDINGDFSGTHTVYWTHELRYQQPDVHSFIIERRDSKDGIFREIAVTDANVREYQSSNLTGDYYEYRVRTQTSEPSEVVGSRFTTSYEVSKTGELQSYVNYRAVSNDFVYRVKSEDNHKYQVYRYQTAIELIDLYDADFNGDLSKYMLIDASFSEDGRSVAFLLGQINGISSAAFIYNIDQHDFIYVQNYLKRENILHLYGAQIAYSASLGKAIYLNKLYYRNKLGIIDVGENKNTTIDFPTGFYNSGNGLIPFEDKFVMYNGSRTVIDISEDNDGNLGIEVLDYRPIKVNEADAQLYEYRQNELFIIDLDDYTELKTSIAERIGNLHYYYESDDVLFHRGPINNGQSGGLYFYDPDQRESVKASNISFDFYMQANNGIKCLRDGEDYLIQPSIEKKWRKVIRPSVY